MQKRTGAPWFEPAQTDMPACPLMSPWIARIPGILALLAVPAAIFVSPPFFGLAGGLLASINLLLAPDGNRSLGAVGLFGAVAGSLLGVFAIH